MLIMSKTSRSCQSAPWKTGTIESTARIVLADLGLDADVGLVVGAAERAELVDHLVARLAAEVVDAGDVDEVVVAELLHVGPRRDG